MKKLEEFIDNEVVLHKDKLIGLDKASQRLDKFYFQCSINITNYTSFASMLKFVCILSLMAKLLLREVLVLEI